MGMLGEIGNDFMKLIATLGIIIGMVVMFLLWSAMGIWAIVAILVIAAAAFMLWKFKHRSP